MTVAATTTSQQYVQNGTTTQFSFPNKIFAASDLIVSDVNTATTPWTVTTLGLGTNYSVQNVDVDTGAMVTLLSGGTTGHVLDIRTQTPALQSTSVKNQGAFYPELHEEFFDRATREIQDLKRLTYSFGIHGPDIESTPWPALPQPSQRLGQALMFDPITGLPTLGVPNTQTITQGLLAPFLNLGPTAAELAAAVVLVNLGYSPGNVLRYGADPTGTNPSNVALQAAANQMAYGGANIYLPTGTYSITTAITPSASSPFVMQGDGMGKSIINFNYAGNFLNVTLGANANNLVLLENFSINVLNVATSIVFNIAGGNQLFALTIHQVLVYAANVAFSGVTKMFSVSNCAECSVDRLAIYGGTGTATQGFGFAVTETASATVWKFSRCSMYSIAFPFSFVGSTNPGIEGIQFQACDLTGCIQGINWTSGNVYSSPQLTWLGGHINASGANFVLTDVAQVTIIGGLFYNTGGASSGPYAFIAATNVSQFNVQGNIFQGFGVNTYGMSLTWTNLTVGGGIIANNQFAGLGSGSYAFLLALGSSGNNVQNLVIRNNTRSVASGAGTFSISGTMDSTVVIEANGPEAGLNSANAAVTANGATIPTAYASQGVTSTGAYTGIILAPGTYNNQKCAVMNLSAAANTLTMAAAGTSNVADGVSCVIAGLTKKDFTWNSVASLWYHS